MPACQQPAGPQPAGLQPAALQEAAVAGPGGPGPGSPGPRRARHCCHLSCGAAGRAAARTVAAPAAAVAWPPGPLSTFILDSLSPHISFL